MNAMQMMAMKSTGDLSPALGYLKCLFSLFIKKIDFRQF